MKISNSFLLILLVLASCSTNPLTGRKSLSLVGDAEIIPQAFTQYREVLSKSKVDNTSENAKMIKRVGEKLKAAAEKYYRERGLGEELKNYQWEYNLIINEELNAWCMPGGKIAFYSGIIPVCKNEAGVAVVMGHEIVHALAKHSSERLSQQYAAQGLGNLLGVASAGKSWGGIFNQLYPMASGLTILKYGRNQELDADKAGLFLMAKAGYDPTEAPRFWQRMRIKSTGGQKPPQFLSTHPADEERIAQLNQYMPEALTYFRTATVKK
ncbi:MAG: M48 family metallopeptidase [Solirubrobacteraceae bacterium]